MHGAAPTVFIVDDAAEVRKSLSRVLGAAGYQVRSFESAEGFLAEHHGDTQGCLLLDICMPGLSGIELQHALVRSPNALPIVFLTGMGDIQTSVDAMKEGAVDFLTKPIDNVRLFAAVDQALRRDEEQRVQVEISPPDPPSPRNAYATRTASDGAGHSWPSEQADCRGAGHRGKDRQSAPRTHDVEDGRALGRGARTTRRTCGC